MLGSGRVRLALGVAMVSLFSFPGIAHACSPEAYLTPEELASGAYDLSPAPWESGAKHSHDAPAAGAAPTTSPDPVSPPSDPPAADAPPAATGGQAPAVTTQTVQERPAQRKQPLRSGDRPAPAPTQQHRHATPASSAGGISPRVGGLVKRPAGERSSTAPATKPARRPERARAAEPRRARPAAEAERQAPVRQPLAREPEAGAKGTSPADGTPIAAIGIALAAAAGLAAAVLWRRRGGELAVRATDPAHPAPPGHDYLEAELQAIIAEEQANRAGAPAVPG